MVWVAFALLPFSSRKAGTTAAAVDEAAAQGTLAEVSADPTGAESAATRKASADADDGDAPRRYRQDAGGWLRGMIAYDMLCFGLVLGWVLWCGGAPPCDRRSPRSARGTRPPCTQPWACAWHSPSVHAAIPPGAS
jgi:hypothetical protein